GLGPGTPEPFRGRDGGLPAGPGAGSGQRGLPPQGGGDVPGQEKRARGVTPPRVAPPAIPGARGRSVRAGTVPLPARQPGGSPAAARSGGRETTQGSPPAWHPGQVGTARGPAGQGRGVGAAAAEGSLVGPRGPVHAAHQLAVAGSHRGGRGRPGSV